MAEVLNAPTKASDKKAEEPKKKIFGEQKSPDLVIYRLIAKNDKTQRMDTPDYPPYRRFPNIDIIKWEDGTREIRWLPGEQSIFVDEQEKNGRKIPDNIIHNPNNRFEIIDGYIRVAPHQKAKIKFLDMCNRNVESEYRTGSVEGLFSRYTEEKRIEELKVKQVKQKEAMQKAFEATDEMVYAHARILNIPLINNLTNGSRDYEAIVTDYRQTAMDNPIEFLRVYDSVK
jgi:hypothetical protein